MAALRPLQRERLTQFGIDRVANAPTDCLREFWQSALDKFEQRCMLEQLARDALSESDR